MCVCVCVCVCGIHRFIFSILATNGRTIIQHVIWYFLRIDFLSLSSIVSDLSLDASSNKEKCVPAAPEARPAVLRQQHS